MKLHSAEKKSKMRQLSRQNIRRLIISRQFFCNGIFVTEFFCSGLKENRPCSDSNPVPLLSVPGVLVTYTTRKSLCSGLITLANRKRKDILHWLIDPKFILRAPLAPINTNFDGERATKKKVIFFGQNFPKVPENVFLACDFKNLAAAQKFWSK